MADGPGWGGSVAESTEWDRGRMPRDVTARHFCLGRTDLGGGVDDDLGEADGVEAGSADEGAVDVFEAAEAGGVVGLY